LDLQFYVGKRRLDVHYYKPTPSKILCVFIPEYVTTGLCKLTVKMTTAHFHLSHIKPNFCTLSNICCLWDSYFLVMICGGHSNVCNCDKYLLLCYFLRNADCMTRISYMIHRLHDKAKALQHSRIQTLQITTYLPPSSFNILFLFHLQL